MRGQPLECPGVRQRGPPQDPIVRARRHYRADDLFRSGKAMGPSRTAKSNRHPSIQLPRLGTSPVTTDAQAATAAVPTDLAGQWAAR